IGRAARHVNAEVVLYADKVTESMQSAMEETNRRRDVQMKYNAEHGITPQTVETAIDNVIEDQIKSHEMAQEAAGLNAKDYVTEEYKQELHAEMLRRAKEKDFEGAIEIRDLLAELEGKPVAAPQIKKKKGGRKFRQG